MKKMKSVLFIFANILFALFWNEACGVCFFGADEQGHYLTQSTVSRGSEITYLDVIILRNSIPVWGNCHRRFGNNVILSNVAGGTKCMHCLHFVARSTHIIQVHTEGLERCYTNEGAALTQCPTEEHIAENTAVEMMLYKKSGLDGRLPPPIYCPIEGNFRLTYDFNDGTEGGLECPTFESRFSNCPRGNEVVIRFLQCSFSDFEKSFECLGSWNGTRGQHFLTFRDPHVDAKFHTTRTSLGPAVPKYRCALYARDPGSNKVFLAFSSDSTCFNNLRSAWEGFESLVLAPQPTPAIPALVTGRGCVFPSWAWGQWEQLEVTRTLMTFVDMQKLKTFSVHCLGPPSSGMIPVYTQSQCGDERFACLVMEQRSPNVIEFRIDSTGFSLSDSYRCSSQASLSWPQWITQGKVNGSQKSPCPVAGEYTGTIPDENTLCAKLYSDCNNPEVMFYTVYACYNRSQIFEEREYRCLGQWEETGVTYTYTERRDVLGYECFAGVMTRNEIFIVEAGTDCERGIRPLTNGMKLFKLASCQGDEWQPAPNLPSLVIPLGRENTIQNQENNHSLENISPTSHSSRISWSFEAIFLILISIVNIY